MNLSLIDAAPYGVRSARSPVIVKAGSSWYSTCARSGAPDPAVIAVRSLVYPAAPCPALTTLTLMFGYFCSKSATSSSIPPTQVQNVRVVGLASSAAICASVITVVLVSVLCLLQPARDTAASDTATR